jgi:hypothetical protein
VQSAIFNIKNFKKGLTSQGIILGLISIILAYVLKTYIFPNIIPISIILLNEYIITFELPGVVLASILALLTRLGLIGVIESILEDFKSGFFNYLFSSSRGEGSSNQPNQPGRVIGPEDFIYDSDSDWDSYSEREKKWRSPHQPQSSQEIGDSTLPFKDKIKNMPKEDINETKEIVTRALIEYENSGANVPAAAQQMEILRQKLQICEDQLLKLENENESKGKGKEIAREDNTNRTGDNSQKLIPNPNYRPVPSSKNLGNYNPASDPNPYNYVAYDSEEEQKALEWAIAESKKTAEDLKENSPKDTDYGEENLKETNKSKGKEPKTKE